MDLPAAPRYSSLDDYLAEVKKLIESRWVYPPGATRRRQSGEGMLRFDIARDGTVRCVTIERSTEVVALDRAIVEAVIGAVLPPPPDGTPDPLSTTLRFTYVFGEPKAVSDPPQGPGSPAEP